MRTILLSEIAAMTRAEAEERIRANVQTIYLGEKRVLSRILGGPKLFLSTDDIGFACHVMMDGFWEIWLTQFFARYLRPGMTAIDVGANFGYYTVLFADAVGPQGRVVSVEPVPSTAELLAKSVALNGFAQTTRVARMALGRSPEGQVHLLVPEGEPKNATVVGSASPGTIEVASTNLDTLLAGFDRVDLIKIDAEGAEQDILAGMREIISRHAPALMLEFNAARYADAKGFLAELRGSFASIQSLDFNGKLVAVRDTDLLERQVGEDWLLFLEGKK